MITNKKMANHTSDLPFLYFIRFFANAQIGTKDLPEAGQDKLIKCYSELLSISITNEGPY